MKFSAFISKDAPSRDEERRGKGIWFDVRSYEIVRVEFCRAHVWFPIESPRYGVRLRYVSVNSVHTYT